MSVSQIQLDHFLDFITSPHVIKDLPFGEKSVKLSTKEIITVPNSIRMIIPESILKQYLTYSQECGFTPLSRRTLLRIPTVCSASLRKSLQGLDYISSAGGQAFDDLADVVNRDFKIEKNFIKCMYRDVNKQVQAWNKDTCPEVCIFRKRGVITSLATWLCLRVHLIPVRDSQWTTESTSLIWKSNVVKHLEMASLPKRKTQEIRLGDIYWKFSTSFTGLGHEVSTKKVQRKPKRLGRKEEECPDTLP